QRDRREGDRELDRRWQRDDDDIARLHAPRHETGGDGIGGLSPLAEGQRPRTLHIGVHVRELLSDGVEGVSERLVLADQRQLAHAGGLLRAALAALKALTFSLKSSPMNNMVWARR